MSPEAGSCEHLTAKAAQNRGTGRIDYRSGASDLPGVNHEPKVYLRVILIVVSVGTERITIEPGKRGGKPCVRGLRITVWDILGWLGAGITEAEILDEHPDLEKDDFAAVYQFAAEAGRRAKIG